MYGADQTTRRRQLDYSSTQARSMETMEQRSEQDVSVNGTSGPTESAGDRGRVLLVDDNDLTREVYATLLRLLGYDVFEAESAQAALARGRTCRPDVVLLDIRLPDICGWDTGLMLKSDPATSSCALLAFSASIDSTADLCAEDRHHCFDGYVHKPVPTAELARRLQIIIEERRRQQVPA
jgi:CheY-like chemotaxis protein